MNFEIDITLKCNFKCPSCNRLCDLDKKSYENTIMNMQDIQNIWNSISLYCDSNSVIRLMGGEPTLNPYIYDMCHFFNDKKIITEIMTNLSNKDILIYIKNNFKNIRIRNLDNNNYKLKNLSIDIIKNTKIQDIVKSKKIKHFNSRIDVNEFQNIQKTNMCRLVKNKTGINIRKLNNIIYYYPCSCGMTLCLMLDKYDFLYTSLNDLIKDDNNLIHNRVCKHCMESVSRKDWILFKDNSNVSDIFLNGINKYIKD